jgi:hypothetical protein
MSIVQLDYPAEPNLMYNFKSVFNTFLRDAAAARDDFPVDIESMADDYGIKLVETHADAEDVDRVGYVRFPIYMYSWHGV